MKFPVWLQIALAMTVGLSGWSLLYDETLTPEETPHKTAGAVTVTTTEVAHTSPRVSDSDLFPYQGPPAAASVTLEPHPAAPLTPAETEPHTPPLPFQIAGAWWQGNQRFLLLTDSKQSWLVCQQCRLAGAIRGGEKLNENWQLRAIAPDHLVLRRLPLEDDQRLPLGEMQSKPGF